MHKKPTLRTVMKAARQDKGWSTNELADQAGTSQSTITRIENGVSLNPDLPTLEKIAKALGLTLPQLRGEVLVSSQRHALYGNVEPVPDVTTVPLIEWADVKITIHNGLRTSGIKGRPVYTTRAVSENAYALRILDDTMENPSGAPSFPKGSTIVVDPEVMATNGQFGVFVIGDIATFKQLVTDAGKRYLKPLNPRYPIMEIPAGTKPGGTLIQLIMDF